MKNTLEKQLSAANKAKDAAEKKVNSIKAQIAKQSEAKKPKTIWESITTLAQVYKKLKVNPKNDVLKIEGFSKGEKEVVEGIIEKIRVCKVLNEGKLPAKNERWYTWNLRNSSGSGLAFNGSTFDVDYADASSAARLTFLDSKRSNAYGKNFMSVEEKIIQL